MKVHVSDVHSMIARRTILAVAVCLLVFGSQRFEAAAQSVTINRNRSGLSLSGQRERGREMLKQIKEDISKNYYDPTFHGIDLDARFKEADERIKQADSSGLIYGIIAHALLAFNDSHTYFIPPEQFARTDYGWTMQMIGDACYVTSVKPGSDAEAKGLKAGDRVVSMFDVVPTRASTWMLRYLYYRLRPQPSLQVVVQSLDEEPRQLDLAAKVMEGKPADEFMKEEVHTYRHHYYEMGDDLFIWRMPRFDLTESEVDGMMKKVGQRRTLILDLRSNGGGYEIMLKRLLGYFFDHDVKIGDIKGRKDLKPVIAQTRGDKVFKGNLVVLVDSNSGSASELFARVIQLEKRGTVIGDRSAGAVMRARHYQHQYE